MDTGIVCVGIEVEAHLILVIVEVQVGYAVRISEFLNVLVPLRVPAVFEGRADQDESYPFRLAQIDDLLQVVHRVVAELRIEQGLLDRVADEGFHVAAHVVAVVGSDFLGEDALPVGRGKLAPALVVSQYREDIGQERLAFHHGGVDRIDLDRRPLHAVQRHAVVGLEPRLVELHRVNGHDDDLGRLDPERILQEIVRLPDVLLARASDVSRDAVVLVHLDRREILIRVAVAEDQDLMRDLLLVVLLGKRPFDDAPLILGHKKALGKPQRSNAYYGKHTGSKNSLKRLVHYMAFLRSWKSLRAFQPILIIFLMLMEFVPPCLGLNVTSLNVISSP